MSDNTYIELDTDLCIICLEKIDSNEAYVTNICVKCDVKSHVCCLNEWYQKKNKHICPICLKTEKYYLKDLLHNNEEDEEDEEEDEEDEEEVEYNLNNIHNNIHNNIEIHTIQPNREMNNIRDNRDNNNTSVCTSILICCAVSGIFMLSYGITIYSHHLL